MTEYTEVEQPFLAQLHGLGWQVLDQGAGVPSDPAVSLRESFRQVHLPQIFRRAVRRINRTESGAEWLSEAQLDDLEAQLQRQPRRSLLEANENLQQLLFKAQVDQNELTGEQDPVVKLIDFEHPANNHFQVINQFRLDTPGCVKAFIIPDIVLFVNGIPLVVVECKKGSETCANPMQEAFTQLQRYMNKREATARDGLKEGEPRLFFSNLMLVRSCGTQADYGTISSGVEHFYAWKTAYPADDITLDGMDAQQQLIQGMLSPQNLLQLLRCCSVFMDTDAGIRIKVLARYQQFRAANRILDRMRAGESALQRSGVVWHTQGSGKSLTMVFVARMLRASDDLNDLKIILVNDRQDLEQQLGETATLIGGKVNVIESAQGLRSHLASQASDINMVMVHKFQERSKVLSNKVAEALGTYTAMPAGKTFGVVNNSDRIVLMIDEAHRTQGSDLGDNVFEAFPNATRVAFTGTPLLTERHGERKTHKRFGEYIDTYRLMDAVDDGATLQILYEGKTADSALNEKHAFDEAFEDLFRERSDEELLAIKKKYGASGDILEAEARIEAIARDLVNHYVANILPNGFKAQVVCHSKLACIRYQKAIRAALVARIEAEQREADPDQKLIAKLGFLKAAVVVSGDGTNESAAIANVRKEARRMNAVENFCKSFVFPHDESDPQTPNPDYDLDKENTGIAFLIVCDMLLTGFDAPIEQVMYIDKKLTEHNLLQAIARTNRVKIGKKRGYIVDYIGLSNSLLDALDLYSRDDAGEELEELRDGLKNINSELPVLDERYQRLLQQFVALGVMDIKAFVEGRLATLEQEAEVVHKAVKKLKDEKERADFEIYLKKFLASLDVVLPNAAAQPFRVPAKRFGYILHVAKQRYKDTSLDLGDAGEKVKLLINEHLISLGINPKIPPVELLSDDFIQHLNRNAGDNKEAKASEMEHAIRKHCTVHHDEDPAFYQSLSAKVDSLIEKHREDWDLLVEKLAELRKEAIAGREQGEHGMSKEATTFYEHIIGVGFEGGKVPQEHLDALKALMEQVVDVLQDSIGSIDYWQNPDKQKRTRSQIKSEITKTGIASLKANRERVAVEIMKLAKNRHDELVRQSVAAVDAEAKKGTQ
ncbi:MAG: HsdR family type I site-specific deoxyribonuclease [Pseudomonadota bacterium]|nr:HsdR family type I site-specific deoxyribonuclease [Pseudomonadota bacterium]